MLNKTFTAAVVCLVTLVPTLASADDQNTHTVKKGQYLSLIARIKLGNGNLWPAIVAKNPEVKAPNYVIYPEQELKLPTRQEAVVHMASARASKRSGSTYSITLSSPKPTEAAVRPSNELQRGNLDESWVKPADPTQVAPQTVPVPLPTPEKTSPEVRKPATLPIIPRGVPIASSLDRFKTPVLEGPIGTSRPGIRDPLLLHLPHTLPVIKLLQAQVIPKILPGHEVRAKVTGYCPCDICSGYWKNGKLIRAADGLTSRSKNAYNTHGVAADPRLLPYGTVLEIPGIAGNRIREVDDTGGAMCDAGDRNEFHIDVRYPTHAEALKVSGYRFIKVVKLGTLNLPCRAPARKKADLRAANN
ncbi:MAG TPA: LysM peptidoglycan-binding domain-containing protein [Verrucomicrobiae bacterium]|nr:LysM peptidoglycan-binding domain-containing protein [Verrucomicrobiae bacterium]